MTDAKTLSPLHYDAPTPQQLEAAEIFVNRWADRWNRPSADGLRDLMHPDTQNLIPPMAEPADREGVVAHFAEVLRRLPDLRLDVLRWAATGDTVMVEWRASATVAGKKLDWTGVDVMRVRGDRGYEAQVYWDTRKMDLRFQAQIQASQQAQEAGKAAPTH